ILTPGSHCYFDHYQSENKDEPLAIGGYLPLEKVYDFNPVPAELTEEEAAYVLGAQGNLWTEYITTPEYAEYMAFPRAIALSEVLWTGTETKDYDAFLSRLTEFKKRMDAMGIHYSDHVDRYVPETLKPAK
ncbi:MAG: family 20 glycosylhydrolase, partial [Flavobacteriaceae bacterium]|nr:family 20 glycosylhydrolase [Flavobacteriaceae bacterium]